VPRKLVWWSIVVARGTLGGVLQKWPNDPPRASVFYGPSTSPRWLPYKSQVYAGSQTILVLLGAALNSVPASAMKVQFVQCLQTINLCLLRTARRYSLGSTKHGSCIARCASRRTIQGPSSIYWGKSWFDCWLSSQVVPVIPVLPRVLEGTSILRTGKRCRRTGTARELACAPPARPALQETLTENPRFSASESQVAWETEPNPLPWSDLPGIPCNGDLARADRPGI